MSLRPEPPSMPSLPSPKRVKIFVLVGLVVVYAGVTFVLTRHGPASHKVDLISIPVDVVKTERHIPPAPPLIVQLQPVDPVQIAPPQIGKPKIH